MLVAKIKNITPLKNGFLNYFASSSLILLFFLFYLTNNHFYEYFSRSIVIFSYEVPGSKLLFHTMLFLLIVLIPYYFTLPKGYKTKSRIAWKALPKLFQTSPLNHTEKTALLSILVKAFFLPMMIFWLFENLANVVQNWDQFILHYQFFPNGYWVFFYLILFVDVFFFTLGYILEHPKLGNEIKSVEPTLFGWVVVLLCYPPFNQVTNNIVGWYSEDQPVVSIIELQWVIAAIVLILMSTYSWASIALNLKASNLTNRGIVSSGPYRWVRHPAYAAKNIAWIIGATPILASRWEISIYEFFIALLSVLTWSYIYYLRAITEERHLMADKDYVKYCGDVKYRFIPGII